MENYEIIYAADDGFAPIMGVSLTSLFENNKGLDIHITILDSGISEENKRKIKSVFENYAQPFPRWLTPQNIEKRLNMTVKSDRGSLAQYSRLYVQDAFEESVKRILYLDCDTIITGTIKELFSMDLKGKTIAGVKDAFSKYYRKNIGLDKQDLMINSGVYIIDVPKWRALHIEDKITDYITKHKGNVQQGDQGVLNAILKDNIFALSPRYNLMSIFYEYSYDDLIEYRKPVNFYSEDEILKAKKSPIVIHYTSAFNTVRPWYKESTHPQTKEWLKYYKLSPWKDVALKSSTRSGVKKLLFDVYQFLPNKLALEIASFFQVYIRPLKNSLL